MTLVWITEFVPDILEEMARNELLVGMEVGYVGRCEDFDRPICVMDIDIDESSEANSSPHS